MNSKVFTTFMILRIYISINVDFSFIGFCGKYLNFRIITRLRNLVIPFRWMKISSISFSPQFGVRIIRNSVIELFKLQWKENQWYVSFFSNMYICKYPNGISFFFRKLKKNAKKGRKVVSSKENSILILNKGFVLSVF